MCGTRDAEARHARNRVGEIGAVLLLEPASAAGVMISFSAVRHLSAGAAHRAASAGRRAAGSVAVARHEMQVRAALHEHVAQELVDASRRVLGRFAAAIWLPSVLIRSAPG